MPNHEIAEIPRRKKVALVPLVLAGAAVAILIFALGFASEWRFARDAVDAAERTETEAFTLAYAKWGTWWAACINAVILLLLAATFRWWGKPRTTEVTTRTMPHVGRMAWIVLAGTLALAGWLRWERSDLSLYNDEAHNFRRYVAGNPRVDKKGNPSWREISWLKTFFFNQAGNNSVPHSVLQRISYETWLKASKAPKGTVNERAMRFPVIVVSLVTIVVLWLTTRRLLSTPAACAAAVVAATHFWMVRYGNEARGYGLNMLAVSSLFYFLTRALEDHRWRWWIGFALAQFLCLWSFSGSIYFVFLLNALIVCRLAWGIRQQGAPAWTLWRPLAAIAFAAMAVIQMMMPTIPQLLRVLELHDSIHGRMGVSWFSDVGALFTSGLHWGNPKALEEHSAMLLTTPFHGALIVALVGLMVLGVLRLKNIGFVGRAFVFTSLLVLPFAWGVMTKKELYLHPWYLTYSLPGLCFLLACAVHFRPLQSRWTKAIPTIVLAGFVVFHGYLNFANRGRCREQLRQIYETVRDGSPGSEKRLLVYCVSDVDVYDRNAGGIRSLDGLETMIQRAQKEGVELWVNYTKPFIIREEMPGIMDRLENPAEFEPVKRLIGMDEAQYTQYLVRWIGKP